MHRRTTLEFSIVPIRASTDARIFRAYLNLAHAAYCRGYHNALTRNTPCYQFLIALLMLNLESN